ncbi:MAG TPA: hypothetical protein VMM35_00970, partial [Longimicrobiales bacterium]|nr:hypothetical protein [Longimicrobiales bacterium]
MPRWTRNRIAGLSLLALTGLVGLCAWALLATTLGLELVWARAAARLPEGVSVSRIGGRLLGPIELAGVRVRSDGADVAVEQVRLEWRARSLLRRAVEVDALEVTGVRIVTLAPAGEDHGGPGPSVESLQALRLPVRLDVRRLSIVDLRFARHAAGESLGLLTLDLRDVSFQDTLIIGAMTAVAEQGRVRAGGWIAPRGSYPLRVEVTWDLTLDDVGALEGSATVSGDLAGLAVDVTTERPLVTRITGSVHDPLGRRTLDVRADVEETPLRSVRADWPEASVAGSLHAVGVLDSLRVGVDARGDSPETGPATVRAELELVDDRIVVERMDVRAGEGRLHAEGSV